MTDQLIRKLAHSIELLRHSEKLALRYDPQDGYYLAFSGGKDSQALYHVAQLAGVKFKAHYNPTTIDPAPVIRFIRQQYPDVEFGKVTTNIFDRAIHKGMLPTRIWRWCCAEFKEAGGANRVVLTGVRRSESTRRSKRNEIETASQKFSGDILEFEKWQAEVIASKMPKNVNQDQFSIDQSSTVHCISGKDKIIVSPIIDWTEEDVWEFLNEVVCVPHCELYDQGAERIGCIMCPMSKLGSIRYDIQHYPRIANRWLQTIKIMRRNGAYPTAHPLVWMANTVEPLTPEQETEIQRIRGGYTAEQLEDVLAQDVFDWWVDHTTFVDYFRRKFGIRLKLLPKQENN